MYNNLNIMDIVLPKSMCSKSYIWCDFGNQINSLLLPGVLPLKPTSSEIHYTGFSSSQIILDIPLVVSVTEL